MEGAPEKRTPWTLSDGAPETVQDELDAMTLRSEYLLEQRGIDPLTELKNRIAFIKELEQALKAIHTKEEHHRAGTEHLKEFSVLFIDLDNFKQVNDRYGHLEGDSVLKKVADVIKSSVRETDTAARFGGDEFYLFLPRVNEAGAAAIARKILDNFENEPALKAHGVSASIGIRSVDASDTIDANSIVEHADAAMYREKSAKKEGQ